MTGAASIQWTGEGTAILHMPLLTSMRRLPIVVDPGPKELDALDSLAVPFDPEPGEIRGCVIADRLWCWKACEGTHDAVGSTIIDALRLDQRGCGERVVIRVARRRRPIWRGLECSDDAKAVVKRLLGTAEAAPADLPAPAH